MDSRRLMVYCQCIIFNLSRPGLNQTPSDCQADALTIELSRLDGIEALGLNHFSIILVAMRSGGRLLLDVFQVEDL